MRYRDEIFRSLERVARRLSISSRKVWDAYCVPGIELEGDMYIRKNWLKPSENSGENSQILINKIIMFI